MKRQSTTFRLERDEVDIIDVKVRLSKNALLVIMYAIALIMMVYGVMRIVDVVFLGKASDWIDSLRVAWALIFHRDIVGVDVPNVVYLVGPVFFIFNALLIMTDHRRSFIRSVGLYAFSMGVTRIGFAIPLIKSGVAPTMAMGWLIFILASNLVISGYTLLSGTVRGRFGMMAGSSVMLLLYLEYFALLMFVGFDIKDILSEYTTQVIACAMYGLLVWLLDTDEIRYGDKLTRHIAILQSIDNTYRAVELMSIGASDARILTDPEFKGWKVVEDGGPAEREFRFVSASRLGTSHVTVQKWKDSDDLYFTVCAHEGGATVMAERFPVKRIVPDDPDMDKCSKIYLKSNNRHIIPITVLNDKEGP